MLGISFQETRFLEKITVLETVRLFASFYRQPEERIEKVIHLVGLEEKKDAYTKNLSGGQRQRLALGISLLNDPEILILDEPTTGLDPAARREIWDILLKLKEKTGHLAHPHNSLHGGGDSPVRQDHHHGQRPFPC